MPRIPPGRAHESQLRAPNVPVDVAPARCPRSLSPIAPRGGRRLRGLGRLVGEVDCFPNSGTPASARARRPLCRRGRGPLRRDDWGLGLARGGRTNRRSTGRACWHGRRPRHGCRHRAARLAPRRKRPPGHRSRCPTRQRGACRFDGVDRAGLALPARHQPVGGGRPRRPRPPLRATSAPARRHRTRCPRQRPVRRSRSPRATPAVVGGRPRRW